MRKLSRIVLVLAVGICLWGSALEAQAAPRLQATGEELVVVIDPGHGGANEGTTENGFLEKEMTLVTAQAMYEELIQYDNITVYMTRTEDVDLSLKQRAEFAASVDADFLFSLHYNASLNHTLYGTEIWIPSQPPFNAYGYQFGTVYLQEMQEKGLFLRGIKTRLNKGADYYGIIRESAALEIPAAILEHCHVDQSNDGSYCQTQEDWKAFGRADALAVAKYFGLSSEKLGVDYGEESLKLPEASASIIVQSTVRDETDPDVCLIELQEENQDTGEVRIAVTATDYDSPMLYYDYSVDGGATYTELIPWPGTDLLEGSCPDSFTLDLTIPSGVLPRILVRAYNLADLYTESNEITFLRAFSYGEEAEQSQDAENFHENQDVSADPGEEGDPAVITFAPAVIQREEEESPFLKFLILCLILVSFIFLAAFTAQFAVYRRRKKRRRQRIKELEEQRYQKR